MLGTSVQSSENQLNPLTTSSFLPTRTHYLLMVRHVLNPSATIVPHNFSEPKSHLNYQQILNELCPMLETHAQVVTHIYRATDFTHLCDFKRFHVPTIASLRVRYYFDNTEL